MKVIDCGKYFEVDGLKCFWDFPLLPKKFLAITLFGNIFFRKSKSEVHSYLLTRSGKETINHERIHILQAKTFKTKYFGFYVYYLFYWVRNLWIYGTKDIIAYRNIPFEREAFANDTNFDYSQSNWWDYKDN
jgi:hypothetical protein